MERSYWTDLSDASSLADLPYTPTFRRLKPVLVRVRLEGSGGAWSSSVQLDSLKGPTYPLAKEDASSLYESRMTRPVVNPLAS
jgi:hypothetical protein